MFELLYYIQTESKPQSNGEQPWPFKTMKNTKVPH